MKGSPIFLSQGFVAFLAREFLKVSKSESSEVSELRYYSVGSEYTEIPFQHSSTIRAHCSSSPDVTAHV